MASSATIILTSISISKLNIYHPPDKRDHEDLHQQVHDGERATMLKPIEMCRPCAMQMRSASIFSTPKYSASREAHLADQRPRATSRARRI